MAKRKKGARHSGKTKQPLQRLPLTDEQRRQFQDVITNELLRRLSDIIRAPQEATNEVLRQFQDVIRAIEDEKNERLRQQFQELSRAAREGENERARQQAQEFGGLDAAREAVSGSFGSRWNEYLARLFEQLALDAPKRIDTRKNKSAATPTADHNQLFGAILTRNRKSLEAGTATIASLAHKYAAKVAPRDAAKRQEVFRAIQAFGYRWDKKLKSDD